MRRLLVAAVVLLSACGGEDAPVFDGNYIGQLTSTANCSDGTSSQSSSGAMEWLLTTSGGALLINDGKPCAPLTARPHSPGADVDPKTCLDEPASGGTLSLGYTGGSVSLSGQVLSVGLLTTSTLKRSGQSDLICDGQVFGKLTRN